MDVYVRRDAAPAVLPADRPALLSEGSWPDDQATSHRHVALDDVVDGRFAEVDAAAERLAETIASIAVPGEEGAANFADVNALRLRYAAVKWLRPIAWLRSLRRGLPERVTLHAAAGRDAEYERLWRAMSEAFSFSLEVEESGAAASPPRAAAPSNAAWRRWLGKLLTGRRRTSTPSKPRVLLCGNPRLLDPVCAELVERGTAVAWLYDRFSVGGWRRWRRAGATQLVCDGSLGRTNRFPRRLLGERLIFDGVDLTDVVETWYGRLRDEVGPSQSRLWDVIGRHVERFRPTHVVVDEDATPTARMLVERARRAEVRSIVVQHGVCGIRFGFAPLKADVFCAWDDGSRRQMHAWGVAARRVVVTGSPYQDQLAREAAAFVKRRTARPTILMLATIPPRDDRPDAVCFHWTTRSYRDLLRATLAAVADLPDAEFALRRHPRTADDPVLREVLAEFPTLAVRDASRTSTAQALAEADVVLSLPSSSSLDAVRLGLPVIQLMPAAAEGIVPAEWYGLRGPATTTAQIRELLHAASAEIGTLDARRDAFDARRTTNDVPAAARIVDLLLDGPKIARAPSRKTLDLRAAHV